MATVVEMSPTGPRELVIARKLRASPAALYRCWTDPKLIPEWFCPRPWRAEVASLDLRAGGKLVYDMIACAPQQIAYCGQLRGQLRGPLETVE